MKFFYKLKREYRLRMNSVRLKIEKIKNYFSQKTCPHLFRPARFEKSPAKICKICDKVEVLTPETFFAEFGEINWRSNQ